MPKPILEQLADGPVLGDGGYVYILKQRGVPMDGYTPYGILTHADAIRQRGNICHASCLGRQLLPQLGQAKFDGLAHHGRL